MKGAIAVLLVAVAADATRCPLITLHPKNLPHKDCDKFYRCSLGRPIEETCPVDLLYSTELEACDCKEKVDCGSRNIPTPCDNSTTQTPPPPPPPCNSTESTTTSTTTTPSTTTSTTTTPSTTTSTTTTTTPPPPTSPPTTIPPWSTPIPNPDGGFLPNGCPANPHIHWLLPVPGDCNGFYYCVWGELVRRACPPGLHFNTPIQVCDWTWRANCTN